MSKFLVSAFATLFASTALADAPRVVVDIAPLHSLVSQVMAGVGEPELLLEPNVSPHSFAMRPSQAVALENADLVVFASLGLTPWLAAPLDALAQNAIQIEVMSIDKSVHHDLREGEDDHDHDHGGEHGDEMLDPHGWLDPVNAKLWVVVLKDALSKADPENAQQYAVNAVAADQALDALIADIEAQIENVHESHYMTLHDAFQYFDKRFGPHFAGSISLGDASAPSPSRIATARAELKEHDVKCVFTEPQQSPRLVTVVIEGTDAKTGSLDPMGAELSPGPNLYSELLRGLANSFTTCLSD
jgi:zinc transport system substrate-binding protein